MADRGAAQAGSRFGTLAALNTVLHMQKEFFDTFWDDVWYPVEWLPLAVAATNQPRSVQVDTQADFAIMGGCFTASDPAAEATIFATPAVSISFLMPGNKSLVGQVGNNNGTTHINNMFGSGMNQAARWPSVYVVPRGGTFQINATNLGAQAYQLRVTVFGFYIYGS